MAVPKRKHSKARSRSRCTHKVEHVTSITSCLNCNSPLKSHQACAECGFYKGVKVLTTKAERSVKRGQALQVKQARSNAAQQDQSVQAAPMNS
ncbi:50S ribosomal protein L32 [Candidatus Babeliales bacterium]|nr:50S ribosomal protein L32 [Candidatus Babeliales bacterium]MBP9843862.1 50S ribosomal protein L32 [Candidatus Babeliales bacterium]